MCVYLSISDDRLVTGVLFTVLHLWRKEINVSDKFSEIPSDCVLSIANKFLFSLIESLRIHLLLNGLWVKTISGDVFPCVMDTKSHVLRGCAMNDGWEELLVQEMEKHAMKHQIQSNRTANSCNAISWNTQTIYLKLNWNNNHQTDRKKQNSSKI